VLLNCIGGANQPVNEMMPVVAGGKTHRPICCAGFLGHTRRASREMENRRNYKPTSEFPVPRIPRQPAVPTSSFVLWFRPVRVVAAGYSLLVAVVAVWEKLFLDLVGLNSGYLGGNAIDSESNLTTAAKTKLNKSRRSLLFRSFPGPGKLRQ